MKKKSFFFVLTFVMVLLFAGFASAVGSSTIAGEMTAQSCIGKKGGKVKKLFQEAGFLNIGYFQKETSDAAQDRLVYEVSVDGKKDFAAGEVYQSDVDVIIRYWVYEGTAPTPAAQYQDEALVMAVQEALNLFGYDCGTPNGVAGESTREAVSAYQASHGLEASGLITQDFVASLNESIDEYNRSLASEATAPAEETRSYTGEITYVLNWNTMKFHKPACASVGDIKPSNREDTALSRAEVIGMGFEPCGRCKP